MKKILILLILTILNSIMSWGAMLDGSTWRTITNGVSTAFTALPDYRCAIGVAWNSCERTESNDPSAIGAGIPTDFKGHFEIPSFLQTWGYGVTQIGYKAFYQCAGMTSVSIPYTITYIDAFAFNGCTGLTEVTIPGTVVTIDICAFACCHNLKTLNLQGGIQTIKYDAFRSCMSLTTVDIPATVKTIGSNAFGSGQIIHNGYGNGTYEGCDNLTKVFVHWAKPISIYAGTFSNAANATLYVPKGTVELYKNANGWNEFKEIKETPIMFADETVKSICVANWDKDGDDELSEEEAAAVTSIGTVFQNQAEITSFNEFKFFTGVTSIGQYALSGCTKLTTIEFPSSMQTFDRYACYNSGFENIVIPDNVTSIGNSAFRNCTALSTIKTGKNSVSFGKNVFRNCTSLSSITFDETECHFNGEDAFRDCGALTSIIITDVGAWCKSSFYSNPLSITKSLLLQTSDNGISVLKALVIPDDITTINSNAFYMCESLESVVIPSSVTSIGSYAFGYCKNLTSMAIPNSVTSIGNSAFYGCSGLTSVIIPNSVTSIGSYAFQNCSGLTSVIIPNSVTSIGSYAFQNCSGLASVSISKSLTSIGEYVFRGCSGLVSVSIPNSVTSIGAGAFYKCDGLTFVSIPNKVTSIGKYAFAGCTNLTFVTVEMTEPVAIDSYAFSNHANITLYVPAGCKASYETASYWKNFKEIVEMPSQLNDGDVFTAKTLENIDMIFKVISVSDKTCQVGNGNGSAAISTSYEGNVTIPSVVYGYRVETIGYRSLRRTNITSVVIPNGIEIIETEAFEQCSKLTSIDIPNGIKTIGAEAFKTCSLLETARIPGSVQTINSEVFKNCYKLNTVVFEDGITKVGSYMFENCSSLASVDLPNSIHSIEAGAFSQCSSLPEIALPQGTSYIGPSAFSGCTTLASFDIPSSIKSIGTSVFFGCTKLSSIVIPEGVTSIGGNAFSGCTDLLYIEFPNTLESIGSQAFKNTKWYENQPDGVVYICNIAYCYKGKMPENTIIKIAEGTIGLSPYAFSSFRNLVEVDIPESVVSIGSWCFNGCSNLTKVKVAIVNPLEIEGGTFSNRGNAYLYVPEGCVDIYSKANVWKDFLSIKQFTDPEMFSGGNGTESNPFIINTIGDMKVLAKDVNSGNDYEGIFFKVGKSEIDFDGVSYTAIGKTEYISNKEVISAFSGTFDGNNVTLKNLSTNKGLFGYIGKKGVVKGIITDETCVITGTGNTAGIAGASEGTISDCVNKASITSSNYHIGGICGDNMGTIINCKNYGTITGIKNSNDSYSGSMMGGIAGDLDKGKIINCKNYGAISGPGCEIGGIVGLVTNYNCTIENCVNKGDVTGAYRVGGIIGLDNTSFNKPVNINNNFVSECTITATDINSEVGAISDVISTSTKNNFYTSDVIVKAGATIYDGLTPRGVWEGYDPSTNSYVTKDITDNCAAMLLQNGNKEDYLTLADTEGAVGGQVTLNVEMMNKESITALQFEIVLPKSNTVYQSDFTLYGQDTLPIGYSGIGDNKERQSTAAAPYSGGGVPRIMGAQDHVNHGIYWGARSGSQGLLQFGKYAAESANGVELGNGYTAEEALWLDEGTYLLNFRNGAWENHANAYNVRVCKPSAEEPEVIFEETGIVPDAKILHEGTTITTDDAMLPVEREFVVTTPGYYYVEFEGNSGWQCWILTSLSVFSKGNIIESAQVEKPEIFTISKCQLTDRKGVDHIASCKKLANGNYQVTVVSDSKAVFSRTEGSVLNLTLDVNKNIDAEDYPISLTNIRLITADAQAFNPADVTAKLTVSDVKLGDVDGNGKISITDAVAVVSHILGEDIDSFVAAAADVDGNGRITITDAVAIVDMILNGTALANERADVEENTLDPQ